MAKQTRADKIGCDTCRFFAELETGYFCWFDERTMTHKCNCDDTIWEPKE